MGEALDRAFEDTQALNVPAFGAFFKKQLHAKANAQKRLARSDDFTDSFSQTQLTQFVHGRSHGTDSGQDNLISPLDLKALVGNARISPNFFQGLLHAPQIPHAVINNCYHKSYLPVSGFGKILSRLNFVNNRLS